MEEPLRDFAISRGTAVADSGGFRYLLHVLGALELVERREALRRA
jgi:hypothetical protein